MADIIKTYEEFAPAARFVGRRYTEADRADGTFSRVWDEWLISGRFDTLRGLMGADWAKAFPEAGSPIGLMRLFENGAFEYRIGMFLPPETEAPEGFEFLDAQKTSQAVCLVLGDEPDIYFQAENALSILRDSGYEPLLDEAGCLWVQERYHRERFHQKRPDGLKTLDLVVMVADAQPAAEDGGAEIMELDPSGKHYCGHCRQALSGERCPVCGRRGTPLMADDPILIGELPGRLRNALQIAFSATEIPFNALANLGSGFTMAAGDLFETYRIYVPYARSQEAQMVLDSVFRLNSPG